MKKARNLVKLSKKLQTKALLKNAELEVLKGGIIIMEEIDGA